MSDLNLQMILRFIDRATGPARAAIQVVERATAAAGESGRRNIALANQLTAANQARFGALQAETAGVIALGAAIYGLTEPAIQAEARLAEVSKFVDFQSPDGLRQLAADARELVTSGGLVGTANGMLDIVAAAGKMGVVDANLPDAEKRRQLLEFAEAAAKMAVAFDISAGSAGDTLALWRQNLKLSQEQALVLGDAVNFLGNTMATNEAAILGVINAQGVTGMQAGLAEREIAALAATILAGGASSEIAATGMKNFLNALTRGESMTKRQSDAFAELGLNGEELARTMQEDATGAILTVLDALNEIDPARKLSLLGDLFGEEAKQALSPLVENADLLRGALEGVADVTQILGLMEEEYSRQAATTLAQRQRFMQFLQGMSVVIGSSLLPIMNEMMETIAPFIARITEWAEANPELIEQIGWIVAGLIGFKLASLALRFALLPIVGTAAALLRGFGLLQVGVAASGKAISFFLRGLGSLAAFSPLVLSSLVRPLVWTAALIPRIAWAALAGALRWAMLIPALRWTAALIPRIAWAALIPALRWVSFIPVIGWAFLAGSLIWGVLIPVLQWLGFIPNIDWSYWFSFEWASVLPAWNWAAIIPSVNIGQFISGLGLGRGGLSSPQNDTVNGGATGSATTSPTDDFTDQLRPDGNFALGGPVRPGFMYRINEEGQEFFQPDTSGRVISARDARGLFSGAPTSPPGNTFGDIHVHAAPGQSSEEIAREVLRRLDRQARRADGALHDGALQ